MNTEGLSVICGGLGSIEEDEGSVYYSRDDYCLDNLKDLLRFLRRDDPTTRDVFKQVCKWDIVSKNLIPIIEHCQDDRNLVLNAVKVLVFLTMPLEATSKDFNEQLEYLWGIKFAITISDMVAVILSLLEKPLENLECNAFSEDDWKLVQLVLTLFRNILAVQDISAHQKASGSASLYLSLRDDFLDLLFRENVMDLIIIITQHVGSSCRYLRHDNLLLLEIYHHIFTGQDAELIAKICLEESKVDGEAKPCLESLKCIMQEETEKRKHSRLHASRHSKFSGAFTRLTLDGSKTMCMGVPSSASCDTKLLKSEKVHRGPQKKIVKDYTRLPTTKRSILERLHDFLNQFLIGGYNVLMQSIAHDIEKEHHAIQTSDLQMFFHLAQFVTFFQYHKSQLTKPNTDVSNDSSLNDDDDDDDSTWFKGDICGPIAATMNDSMFILVIAKWQLAFEGLKETKNNPFLSISGSLMKTMIRMLDLVLKMMPEKSREPQTARIILYKLFYDQTDQGLTKFLLNMFRSFNAHKQPKSDLADLVEIIHVVIRLMEKLQAHGTLRVAKKSRKVRRKKDQKNTESKVVGDDATILNGIQPSNNKELFTDTGNGINERLNETNCDEKENDNINGCSQVDETKISRDEGQNSDGSLPVGDHTESDQIHDPVGDGESNPINEPLGNHDESNQIYDNFVAMGADDCDSSADEQITATDEVDFKMTSLLFSLANSSIISNLCCLLKDYKSNSTATNHYILCLLRRISDDLDLAPMLYQLSFLVIFYDILNEQKENPRKEYENIAQFLTSLIRRMLRKMKDQPLLFVDVLFWKTRKDCHYINVESIQREIGEMKKEVKNWGHGDDTGPSQRKKYSHKSLADALGDDEYDVSIPNHPHFEKDEDSDEAAGEVFHSYGLEDNTIIEDSLKSDFQGDVNRKRRLVLSDKLEGEIRGLYEKYKDNLNCTQLIAEALDPNGNVSPAQVSRKCKKLGLQLPSKKSSMAHLFNDNDQDKEGRPEIDSTLQDLNHADGPSYLGRPMQARKRVRAMDEKQELKIRSLFEHFKDHKRCSHMIAKEIDPDGAVTAAQVSRKLKKLGLRTSRMKGEVNRQKMDEASTDGEDDIDDLTLSAVRKRSKNKVDASSDKELGSLKYNVQSPGSTSDDEQVLGSILKKRKMKRVQAEPEDKFASASTNQEDMAGEDSSNQVAQSLEERDEIGEDMDVNVGVNIPHSSSAHQAIRSSDWSEGGNQQKYDELSESGIGASNHGFPGSDPEKEAAPDTSNDKRGHALDEDVKTIQNVLNYSELEDSGDELAPSASPESSVKRRRLRVVMDFDDDDDDDE
ncbi:LOW QUALITY PROTEIN: protein timeless homolog [Chenopodium quinoa]|uniref:LOW QUALITY PROTEIN: protein timeless homolog n=1 Tax=Chenopodium quinoa TaxID=63459 RepID=UPI000B774208|nr:LOW QUALITY PROTEIN: protein timeless homolog [Chenopodium quinoa]